jgi:hypothetical protein
MDIPQHVGFGAGEGNRTLVVSLEGFCSTIELHPLRAGERNAIHSLGPSTAGLTALEKLDYPGT